MAGPGTASALAIGLARVLFVVLDPAAIGVTHSAGQRQQEFVVADCRRSGPAAAIRYRIL